MNQGFDMILHTRTQHAVGQGFFHSAEVSAISGGQVRYIYDCGSMDKYRSARDARVGSYLDTVGKGGKLDFLFLSHAHHDHVSGLPQLLDTANSGVQVDTIVMPLIDVYDRLIVFAKTASDDAVATRDAFYRDFIVDPVETLSRFNPRLILLVRRGNDVDGGGAPGGDGPGEPGPLLGDGPMRTKLIGRGSVESNQAPGAAKTNVMIIPDTRSIAVGTDAVTWLLAPYVDPTVNAERNKFKVALAHELKMTVRSVGQWLRSTSNRVDLVTNKIHKLEKAYKAVKSNVNITSLCLFSGPANQSQVRFIQHRWRAGKFAGEQYDRKIGWLSTGDAALAAVRRRRSMLKHYRHLLPRVVSFTLPHHGAAGNYDEELIKHSDPDFCIAAADFIQKSWQHPGAQVVQSVASHGALLLTVTSDVNSEFREEAYIR